MGCSWNVLKSMPLYVLNAFAQAIHHGCNASVKKKKRLHERDIQVIQDCIYLIASPLCAIFNQSIISGVFPDEWKLSKLSLCLHVL